jgi:hypothetical protein
MLLASLLTACASDAIHIAQLGPDYHVILENDRVIAFGRGTLTRYPGTDRYFINENYP